MLAGLTNVCDVVGYKKDQEGHVIPTPGKLIYRGVNINEIVDEAYRNDRFVFEEVIWLLLFGSLPTQEQLDEFCEICKHIGIESVELLDPVDWPIVQKHGLTVAMAQGAGLGIDRGFNDPALHDELVASYEKVIPMVADAGLTNLICFSGRRNGVTDLQGWENCEKGLKRLIPLAEKHKVVLTMELLNSVGHKDYLCDHTVWGAELCRRIGSPNFKLLYDIYHCLLYTSPSPRDRG